METLSLETIYFAIGLFSVVLIGYAWFFRIRMIINTYLKMACNIIDCNPKLGLRLLPLYSKNELTGKYKGRSVIIGVQYVGIGWEWMPLPYVRLKLKDVIRYNYRRLPDFAVIKNGWLVFRVKERLVWGIFDRNYSRFFSKDFIIITLTRMLAVAEDTERGRTMGEVFR